ncbi:ATP-binding protein [Microbacterium hominis]|uniref:ATP-binding protein n=1 Tax=Microbacterium hominis TaxID=162426 RepID=UPI00077CD0F1|nr:ATP-binding protein [Microbacterium hominis]
MSDADAAERAARRVLLATSGAMVAAVGTFNLTVVAREHPVLPLWYLIIVVAATAITIVGGALSPLLGTRMLRRTAGAATILFWAAVILFAPAAATSEVERMPWVLTASSAATACALVAFGPRAGWATLAIGTLAGATYRLTFGGFDLDGIVNDSHALLTAAVVCVLGGHVLSVGAGLDAAAAERRAAAARESAERGRLAARTHAAALVHDEVLATLVLAASELPVPLDRLAVQARRAAGMVTSLVDDGAREPLPLDAELVVETRRQGAELTCDIEGPLLLDDGATTAMLGATRQALTNAARHAPLARRQVHLRSRDDDVRIDIVDDGPGFELARIDDDRLGIRQSIVARMERVPGGAAEIVSTRGVGTRVTLRYAPPAPGVQMAAVTDSAALRRGVTRIGVGYVVLQSLCAMAATVVAPHTWALQVAALAAILVTAELLRRSLPAEPSWGRSIGVVGLVVGGTLGTVAVAPLTYGTLWPVMALSFLLVPLALRGRGGTALVGAALVVGVLIAAGAAHGVAPGQILQLITRPGLVVGVAVLMLHVIARMQRGIVVLHHEAVAAAERQSWSMSARAELREHADDLAASVVPLLNRIAEGRSPSPEERRAYAAQEGRLRDDLRAGALAREPLRSAVAAARARGVDVVLLDDSGAAADDGIDAAVGWMAESISDARRHVVGRLHPDGRAVRATIAIDGRPHVFDAVSGHDPSRSFHGE